jgi:PBSX family phage terminase large subunit
MSVAEIQPPFVATAKQNEAARICNEVDSRVIVLDGAYRSSKTQAGARVLVEWAIRYPSTYLVARATYRSLKDSTQAALLRGDGGLPALIPSEVVEQYRASDEMVMLRNGSIILFRSLEEGQVEKLRGLTLGGILVDQLEELDGGPDGERVYDTLLGRLSDPGGPRKLIAITNPAGLTHWVYRRLVNPGTRDANVRHVQFRMADNPHLPADYVAEMLATKETRPHWYESFVEGVWGAFAGMAFPEFSDQVHVVDPFEIPDTWERFQSMDHGAANPTAWHPWAVDHDSNLIVFDEYYSPGRVSEHAPEILRRLRPTAASSKPHKLNWWERRNARGEFERSPCYADPSIRAHHGHSDKWGAPASIATEYADHGMHLLSGNNDRQAGYMRLLELIHVAPGRIPPPWSRIGEEHGGSPRLFVFSTCVNLIAQLKSAPIAVDGTDAGEAIDGKWESAHGHGVAGIRYGSLSRPDASPVPTDIEPEDPRAALMWLNTRNRNRDARRRYLHV